jgi:hypothetical protein
MGRLVTLMVAGALLLGGSSPALAAKAKVSCGKVKAAMEEAGGSKSADEIASQLKTTKKHVDACMAPAKKAHGSKGSKSKQTS